MCVYMLKGTYGGIVKCLNCIEKCGECPNVDQKVTVYCVVIFICGGFMDVWKVSEKGGWVTG